MNDTQGDSCFVPVSASSGPERPRGRRRLARASAFVAAGAALVALLAGSGEAQAVPEILQPSTRPWFFTFGFGPSILMSGDYSFGFRHYGYCGFAGCGGDTQLMLQLELGGHFNGKGDGAALGFGMDVGVGGSTRVEPGLKFWYDIEIADMAVYVTPTAQLGYGFVDQASDRHAFNIQVGCSARVVLGDRGMLYGQLVGVDIHAKRNVLATWNILFGGGVTF